MLVLPPDGDAQTAHNEKHIKVSLRMIAHQILLNSGDSTSRVLPIIKENDQYSIQFESEFEFKPEDLVTTVDSIAQATGMVESYILEVEKCETGEVVYSFEIDSLTQSDIIPCKQRKQPKACYSLLFTLIDAKTDANLLPVTPHSNESTVEAKQVIYFIIGIVVLLLVVIFIFIQKSRKKSGIDPNLIPIGGYNFDKRNTELLIAHQKIELTTKEADLLLLLYNAANTTVERERILNMVWGDEGDYVGRTLDVFISKLRKKLEFDSKVKIVNIRGVGYKLVIDE